MWRVLLIVIFLGAPAAAAPVWEAAKPSVEGLRAAAEDVRSEVEGVEGEAAAALAARAALLTSLADEVERGRKQDSELATARGEVEREAQKLATDERAAAAVPESPTPEGLRQLEGEVEVVRRLLDARTAERARLESRLETFPRRLEEARQRAQTALGRALALEDGDPEPEDGPLRTLQAENARLEARLAQEQARSLSAEEGDRSAAELLDNQVDLAERRLRMLSAELAAWRAAVEQQLADDLTRLRAAVQKEEKALTQATDAYGRFVATERVRLAQADLEVAEVDRVRLELERDLSTQRDRLAVERAELDGVRSAVERDPRSSHTAARLKETFQRLQRRQQGLEQDAEAPGLERLGAIRARRLDVGDVLAAFTDEWRAHAQSLDDPTLPAAERLQRRQALDTLRDQVRGALRRLSSTLTAFIAAGEALRAMQSERVDVFAELDRLVRTRIFWIQDAPPLWTDLTQHLGAEASRGVAWLARLQGAATATALADLARDPLELMLAISLVAGLPIGLLLARRRFARLFRKETHSLAGRVRRTAVGLGLVSLAPLSLLLADVIVGRTGLPDDIRLLLQALLTHLAISLWVWSVVTLVLARDGVLVQHFEVPVEPVAEASSALRLIATGYAVCLLPERVLGGPPLHATTTAHLGIFLFGFVVLIAVGHLLRRRGRLFNALSRAFGDHPDRASLARPFRAAVLAAIALVLGMDTLGYRYGAGRLAWGMFLSVLVVVPLSLIRPAATEAWRHWRTAEDGTLPPAPRWLRPAFVLTGLILLALVWGVDQGAVRLLEGIRLYVVDTDQVITLLDMLGALLMLTATIWLVSSLPRLLRAAVFPYFTMDDGAQYAIASIARYVLFFIGLIVSLGAAGLSPGRLSWLMAALGVGIGFGLQEIVSNFVSGVILLLERPVRVGDFVSVGPIEGRVLHINIRATTILSLDRREIILPNKDLITKEVTNWTLTDRIIRITVVVGVAYGTDVDRVTHTLLEVANNEPVVVREPAPEVIMMRHGSSAMEFELRVHLPDPWVRFRAMDRLNKAINRAFAAQGIEIPFPQQDIHIRSGILETHRMPDELGPPRRGRLRDPVSEPKEPKEPLAEPKEPLAEPKEPPLEPPSGSKEPMSGPKEPPGGSKERMSGPKEPPSGSKERMTGPKEPPSGSEEPMTGPKQPPGGSQDPPPKANL